jgi:hypothetical protein
VCVRVQPTSHVLSRQLGAGRCTLLSREEFVCTLKRTKRMQKRTIMSNRKDACKRLCNCHATAVQSTAISQLVERNKANHAEPNFSPAKGPLVLARMSNCQHCMVCCRGLIMPSFDLSPSLGAKVRFGVPFIRLSWLIHCFSRKRG